FAALATCRWQQTVARFFLGFRATDPDEPDRAIVALVSWLPFSGDQDSPERQLPDPVHPGLLLENQERSEQLFAAIDKLPERQKSALVLYQFEELSYKEICDVLELSLSSVESLIFRAKKNLKKHLQAYFEKRGS
ncbi:MAG: sigma-70 family RNA polymerase sigma factor, partial [Bacteroidota bacterium]